MLLRSRGRSRASFLLRRGAAVKVVAAAAELSLEAAATSMTYHPFSLDSYQCTSCQAYFIPFEQGLPCPRCGARAAEFQDFVAEVAAGLRMHKEWYGRYTPGAYFVGSLAEKVFHILCMAFDAAREAEDFQAALEDHLAKIDWGDHLYARDHILQIAVRAKQRLDST